MNKATIKQAIKREGLNPNDYEISKIRDSYVIGVANAGISDVDRKEMTGDEVNRKREEEAKLAATRSRTGCSNGRLDRVRENSVVESISAKVGLSPSARYIRNLEATALSLISQARVTERSLSRAVRLIGAGGEPGSERIGSLESI